MNLSKIQNRIESVPAVRALGVRLLKAHQMIYERTDGRIGHRLGPTRNLLLRTVGAKTGRPRTNALTYARDGADYAV
ncbi:MAG TPA: nitroreductase/quinone reductase family protein, partial [Jatrophihabitans sp.]|nr:nitroreductase/quinone reductase family protein [Jatrophihabitans sp.]